MTKTEIALAAIDTLAPTRETHVEVLRICKALTMSSDEATELRKELGRRWVAAPHGSDRKGMLGAAKEAANRFAANVNFR